MMCKRIKIKIPSTLCVETLGRRLLESKNDNLAHGALLCFICSGSLNQLVDAWVGTSTKGSSPDELQVI